MKVVISLLFIFLSLPVFASVTSDVEWKTGQVLLISEPAYDPSTLIFELATGSRYGHVGVVSVEEDGVFVYHSDPPQANKIQLEEFLARTQDINGDYNYTLAESAKSLSKSEQVELVSEMNRLVTLPTQYNFSQVKSDEGAMNCSEFVHYSFKSIGRSFGKYTTYSDLNFNGFDGMLLQFAQDMGIQFDEKSLFLSPMSLLLYGDLKVVESTVPYQVISEKEILTAWNESIPLALVFDDMLGFPDIFPDAEAFVDYLFQVASEEPYKKSCVELLSQ